MSINIYEILQEAKSSEASDVHITVGSVPIYRINGALEHTERKVADSKDIEIIVEGIVPNEQMKQKLKEDKQLDFSYTIEKLGRFRVNIYKQMGNYAIAIRILDYKIPKIDDLHLPAAVREIAEERHGLVLITGSIGAGKSTTLAAIIEHINATRKCHIVTIEDPIEYVHPNKKSVVNQREIGLDVNSFDAGLKAALREDVDVILVGELRDLETISMAITAAETGQLVLATLHTNDAPQTINRIIDVFPEHKQNQISTQLASCLRAVVSQRLLKKADGNGRIVATEVMKVNSAISNLIRENNTHLIRNVIQTSIKDGMMTMDLSLANLVNRNLVDYKEARKALNDEKIFENLVVYKGGYSE